MKFEDLKETFFVIEATSYEQLMLWQEWNGKVAWKQDNLGWLETVGFLDNMPVCISIMRVNLNGHWVLFWFPTSQVVDHRLIDKWLDENVFKYTPKHRGDLKPETDPMNFHNCIFAINEANKV